MRKTITSNEKISVLSLLVILLIIQGCSIADDALGVNEGILTDRVAPAVDVIEGTSFAFVDEDNTLTLYVTDPQSGYTYYWSASSGTIEESGTTVTYTAPSIAGDSAITCYGAKDEYVETKKATKVIHNVEILTDNMLWLKADTISGLGSFDAVSSWENTGTNSFTLAQATDANKPRFVPDSLNGKPIVRFVDYTDMLSATGVTGTGYGTTLQGLSFFIVFRPQSLPTTTRYIFSVRNNTTNTFPRIAHITSGAAVVYHYSSGATIPVSLGEGVLLSSVSDMTNPVSTQRVKFWLDGESLGNTVTATSNQIINRIYLGGLAGSSSFTGDIAEIIMFSTALSDDRRQQIESYLAEKWGL